MDRANELTRADYSVNPNNKNADHEERQRLRRELLSFAAKVPNLAIGIHSNGEVALGCETARPVAGGWEWHGYQNGLHLHVFCRTPAEIVSHLAAVRVEQLQGSLFVINEELDLLDEVPELEAARERLDDSWEDVRRALDKDEWNPPVSY